MILNNRKHRRKPAGFVRLWAALTMPCVALCAAELTSETASTNRPGSAGDATNATVQAALWLDASDASTMTLSGSTVTEWRDKNGSAAKMTLRAGAPTVEASGIGGIPTVRFNTSSRMNDGVNHSAPVTIFYVSRQTGGANGRVLAAQNNNWLLGYWNGRKGSAWFDGDVLLKGTEASDTAPHLCATTIPGSGQNSTVWTEGGQIASNTGGTQGPNNLVLGGGGAWAEYSDCDISEVLVYHRVLTPVELNQVGFYLAQKCGVSATYVDPSPPAISTLNPADNATGAADVFIKTRTILTAALFMATGLATADQTTPLQQSARISSPQTSQATNPQNESQP